MKRQQAFINKDNKFLKGGLHCHTTISDGDGDPAEVIRLHKILRKNNRTRLTDKAYLRDYNNLFIW